jgi:hypothetical protein
MECIAEADCARQDGLLYLRACVPACCVVLCCAVLCCVGMSAAVLPWASSQAAMAVYLEQRTARGSMSGCGCWIDAGAAVERVLRCAAIHQ